MSRMQPEMCIWFARHGQSQGSIEGRYGGAADFALSAGGLEQAVCLCEHAASLGIDVVITGPLSRSRETAERIVAGRKRCELFVLPDLQEWNSYGLLSGLTPAEAQELFPDLMKQANGRPEAMTTHLTGAEPIEAFRATAQRAFEQILAIASAKRTSRCLVVTHGKFLHQLATSVLGVAGSASYDAAAINLLRYRPGTAHIVPITSSPTRTEVGGGAVRIYLVRHGEALDDIDGTYGGAADHPLTPRGEEQAKEIAASLRDGNLERIYTSPLRRAAKTASMVAAELGIQDGVTGVSALRERNSYGVLSGIAKDRAWDLFPLILEKGEIRSGYSRQPLLGAEDFDEFLDRVRAAFKDVVDDARKDGLTSIALVTHGTFLRALLADYLRLEYPEDWKHAGAILLEYRPHKATIVPL